MRQNIIIRSAKYFEINGKKFFVTFAQTLCFWTYELLEFNVQPNGSTFATYLLSVKALIETHSVFSPLCCCSCTCLDWWFVTIWWSNLLRSRLVISQQEIEVVVVEGENSSVRDRCTIMDMRFQTNHMWWFKMVSSKTKGFHNWIKCKVDLLHSKILWHFMKMRWSLPNETVS